MKLNCNKHTTFDFDLSKWTCVVAHFYTAVVSAMVSIWCELTEYYRLATIYAAKMKYILLMKEMAKMNNEGKGPIWDSNLIWDAWN